jgi:hypothetical protein
MDASSSLPEPHLVTLEPGAQIVINGALVTAHAACSIEVGSGAFVVTGPALRREREALRHPHEELYFSMLEAARSPENFTEAHHRLFALLAQVAAHSPTNAVQRECAVCAAAMMSGDSRGALGGGGGLICGGARRPRRWQARRGWRRTDRNEARGHQRGARHRRARRWPPGGYADNPRAQQGGG